MGTLRLPQHPGLWMAVELGQAGTGLSLWATRSSSVARGKGWVSNSAESQLGALWVELGVFELGPHSNYGPPLSYGPSLAPPWPNLLSFVAYPSPFVEYPPQRSARLPRLLTP